MMAGQPFVEEVSGSWKKEWLRSRVSKFKCVRPEVDLVIGIQ